MIVVGIAGVTNSGKTEVAKRLHEKLPNSLILRLDDYFLPIDDPRHVLVPELNHFNWELLTSLDIEKMIKDIDNILKNDSEKYLIVEGFLIFNERRLVKFFDRKFFIDLDYETCKTRRMGRTYDPPDVPGYFENVVWPEALKSKEEIKNGVENVIFFDGTLTLDKIVNEIAEIILNI